MSPRTPPLLKHQQQHQQRFIEESSSTNTTSMPPPPPPPPPPRPSPSPSSQLPHDNPPPPPPPRSTGTTPNSSPPHHHQHLSRRNSYNKSYYNGIDGGGSGNMIAIHRVDLFDSGLNVENDYHQHLQQQQLLMQRQQKQQHRSMSSDSDDVDEYGERDGLQHSKSNENNNNDQSQNQKEHDDSTKPSCAVDEQETNEKNKNNIIVDAETWMKISVIDTLTPNPFPIGCNPGLTKYWNQRRRLFSRFDQGIQLDEESWYSVTPEQIADHVAGRLIQLCRTSGENDPDVRVAFPDNTSSNKLVILDAFCGCGGNAIAFAKHDNVLIVCLDVDRTKLRMAASNAALYEIPTDRILFIECNALFVLEFCYRHGIFVLDEPIDTPEAATRLMSVMPPPTSTERSEPGGYHIGGIDMLPSHIDAIFMDPPWGGVDYESCGRNGYDLNKHVRIQKPTPTSSGTSAALHAPPPAGGGGNNPLASLTGLSAFGAGVGVENDLDDRNDGVLDDGFFDSFQSAPRNRYERRVMFNATIEAKDDCVDGGQLLQMARSALSCSNSSNAARRRHRRFAVVAYDVPRNTSRTSLVTTSSFAGYTPQNCHLDEHYMNGRLKTATAYFVDNDDTTNGGSCP